MSVSKNEELTTLLQEIRADVAAQRWAIISMMEVVEDLRPTAAIHIANDLAVRASHVVMIDKSLSKALDRLSREIRVRG